MRITSQCSRRKQIVIRRDDKVRVVQDAGPACGNFSMLIVAGQQIDPRDIVSWHHPLNFIENRDWIKRGHLGFEIVGFEPDGVAIGFARLGTTSLSHIGASATAKWNE